MINKNDIILAIKNLDTFLKVPKLKGATVKLKNNGEPLFYTGGFTMVFQLLKENKKWAFRIWHTGFTQQKKRFQEILNYIKSKKLPYFADFSYDENGLLVNGALVDTIRMQWLEGDLLKDYLEKNYLDKTKIKKVADTFFKMCEDLHIHKISHGDLQHGNIFIDNQENIQLIDYDSICVSNIEGEEELVSGLKGYQHPSRFAEHNKTTLKADYFSELVIYLSLIALAESPQLWEKYNVWDTEILLFSEEDFKDIKLSTIYSELKNINSVSIDGLLDILEKYLKEKSYLDLQPFESYLQPLEIVEFQADKEVIIDGQQIRFSWKVKGAKKVEIDNGVGEVNIEDNISVLPTKTGFYKLKATNYFGDTCEKELAIKIFPTPIIESLLVPMPQIEQNINIHIHIPSPITPQIDTTDVSLKAPFQLSMEDFELSVNVPEFAEPNFYIPSNFKLLDKIEDNFQKIKRIINKKCHDKNNRTNTPK
jgi:serine/threonine protein kinase